MVGLKKFKYKTYNAIESEEKTDLETTTYFLPPITAMVWLGASLLKILFCRISFDVSAKFC